MAFVAQSFSVGDILTAANMNQVDTNIDIVRAFHKGPSAPASLAAGVQWLEDDNPSATVWTWQMYDGTDWLKIGEFDSTANTFTPEGVNPSALAGVLETNANFVDACFVGPTWDKTQAFSGTVIPDWDRGMGSHVTSHMIATVEDTGADAQVNWWDFTDASIVGATPLATLTITGAATPTSITSLGGYIMVGHEDGVTVYSPFSGAWAEQTVGYPKSLSTSTVPALTNNDVQAVGSSYSDASAKDPNTGGPMPSFGISYGTGADIGSLYKYDGSLYDKSGTVGKPGVLFVNGHIALGDNTGALDRLQLSDPTISTIVADAWASYDLWTVNSNYPRSLGHDGGMDRQGNLIAGAGTSGLTLQAEGYWGGQDPTLGTVKPLTARINRTYNTGYEIGDIRSAWLANSKTLDRSGRANTLTENGTVTEAAVETGAELMGYSGFSDTTNWLSRAYDADFDFGTGDFSVMFWWNRTGSTGSNIIMRRTQDPVGGANIIVSSNPTTGTINFQVTDGTDEINFNSTSGSITDSWHFCVCTYDGGTQTGEIFFDTVSENTATNTSIGSISNGTALLTVGSGVGGAEAADETELSLFRISATKPTAAKVKAMYEAEKGMFVASAKCLLQSGTTDAVLDVSVDPVTGKVAVTQTDALMIWDGLVVESEPAIDAAGTNVEHLKLFNNDWLQINDTNASVSIAALNVREELTRFAGQSKDGGRKFLALTDEGYMVNPTQPIFFADSASDFNNVTGDGTIYTTVFDRANINVGGHYDTTTGIFTAPVAGTYYFEGNFHLGGLTSSHNAVIISLTASNRTGFSGYAHPYACRNALHNVYSAGWKFTVDMDAGDTYTNKISVYSGTKVVDIQTGASQPVSWFAGWLVA